VKVFKAMLVDDHPMVRSGFRNLVDDMQGFSVVAEAGDIDEAMEKLRETAPDIVVTDIDMGTDNGLDLVRRIKKQTPATIIVIFSMHSSEELVSEALALGASAYLLKKAAPEELEMALAAVAQGETFLSPAVSTKMINRLVRPPTLKGAPLKLLTARQIQILRMIAAGMSAKEVAYELDLSDRTVIAHRSQIMERLNIHDLAGLVLFAVKHGLVKLEES